jgi:hypothetical protein
MFFKQQKVMKKLIITAILATIVAAGTTIMAQDQPAEYLGLPGDNLNLYAVMKLFQESETLEGFERSLNDENSRINNLDLNGDNVIDYIRVTDYVDGNVHTIVLQAVLGRNDSQDVAVFTVQKLGDGSVQIQLTGDEALYGRNYIIEPNYDGTPNPGYMGRADTRNVTVVHTTTIQVAAWPLIRFMFMPGYVVWRSSWYWGYYPVYWHPWHPFYWDYYYGFHSHWYPYYYGRFRRWDAHRYSHWDDFYYHGKRTFSPNVAVRIHDGAYRNTYSHPEERKKGEDLYYRTYNNHGSRQPVTSTMDRGRRVNNGTYNGRNSQGAGTGSNRRITTSQPSNRSNSTPSSVNNSSNGRGSQGDKMNNKTGEKNQPNGNATNWKNRSNNNTGNSGRATSDVSGSNNSRPGNSGNAGAGTIKREAPVNVNPSSRRSNASGNIKTNTGKARSNNSEKTKSTTKDSGKKNTGKDNNSSRRK